MATSPWMIWKAETRNIMKAANPIQPTQPVGWVGVVGDGVADGWDSTPALGAGTADAGVGVVVVRGGPVSVMTTPRTEDRAGCSGQRDRPPPHGTAPHASRMRSKPGFPSRD